MDIAFISEFSALSGLPSGPVQDIIVTNIHIFIISRTGPDESPNKAENSPLKVL